MPKISAVMPSYNHERFIDEAIRSVINQTVQDWELVIVDDFSLDRSRQIIEEWAKKEDRIKTLYHDKNEGIAKTCDDGIAKASGEYVALMASDDMWRKDAFQVILNALEESKCEVALVDSELIDAEGKKKGVRFSALHRKPSKLKGNFFKDLIKGNFVCTGVFKKEIINKYDIRHNSELKRLDDWLFWLDLSFFCNFIYIDEPLYYYRVHGSNSSLDPEMAEDGLKVYDVILRKYGSKLDDYAKSVLLKNKALSYLKQAQPSRFREYLLQSLKFNPLHVKSLLLLFLSYMPNSLWLYTKYRDVRNIRRKI